MGGLGNKFDAKFEVVYNKNMKNKMIIQQQEKELEACLSI